MDAGKPMVVIPRKGHVVELLWGRALRQRVANLSVYRSFQPGPRPRFPRRMSPFRVAAQSS